MYVESHSPSVNGTPIPALKWKDRYRYLGLSLGRERGGLSVLLKDNILSKAKKIATSLLTDWQRTEAINIFVLPLADYYLNVGLVSSNWVRSVDAAIRRAIKATFNLPRKTTTPIFYLSQNQGGYDLRSLEDRRDTARISSALCLLSSQDLHISWNQLHAVSNCKSDQCGGFNYLSF